MLSQANWRAIGVGRDMLYSQNCHVLSIERPRYRMVLYIAMGIGVAFDSRRGANIRSRDTIRAPEESAAARTRSRTGANVFRAGQPNGDHPGLFTRNQTFCNPPTPVVSVPPISDPFWAGATRRTLTASLFPGDGTRRVAGAGRRGVHRALPPVTRPYRPSAPNPHSSSRRASRARSSSVRAPLRTRISRGRSGRPSPPGRSRFGRDGRALHPVGADGHGEQRVAVLLTDAVPRELGFAEIRVELRVRADHIGGEARHVSRGHGLPRPAAAPGVGQMRAGHPQLAGALVHQCGERFFRAGDALGQGDRRIVAQSLDDETAQQVVDADLREPASANMLEPPDWRCPRAPPAARSARNCPAPAGLRRRRGRRSRR